MVRRRKRILLRNEAQLNFVSLRSPFDYVARRGLSRVEMNAQKTGALDSPSAPREECFHFLFDNADVVIEGMLRKPAQNGAPASHSFVCEFHFLGAKSDSSPPSQAFVGGSFVSLHAIVQAHLPNVVR